MRLPSYRSSYRLRFHPYAAQRPALYCRDTVHESFQHQFDLAPPFNRFRLPLAAPLGTYSNHFFISLPSFMHKTQDITMPVGPIIGPNLFHSLT